MSSLPFGTGNQHRGSFAQAQLEAMLPYVAHLPRKMTSKKRFNVRGVFTTVRNKLEQSREELSREREDKGKEMKESKAEAKVRGPSGGADAGAPGGVARRGGAHRALCEKQAILDPVSL